MFNYSIFKDKFKCALCGEPIEDDYMENNHHKVICRKCANSIYEYMAEKKKQFPFENGTQLTSENLVDVLNNMITNASCRDAEISFLTPGSSEAVQFNREDLLEYLGDRKCFTDEDINNLINMNFSKSNERSEDNSNVDFSKSTPIDIKREMDEYIIGQDKAKKKMAIALYNHYKMIAEQKNDSDDVEIQKSNILMTGPTGCGKTLLAKVMAKIAGVPFAVVDATSLTASGYVGNSVDDIFESLLSAANGDVKKAERGIVYIDEIDKISSLGNGSGSNISTESVQQELLKVMEGTEIEISIGNSPIFKKSVVIDTTNILFICGGAFSGLNDIVKKRIAGSKTIGFGSDISVKEEALFALDKVTPKDFVSYGMISEFVGRLPVIVVLDELNENDLVSVLTQPKNAIVKQYEKLFMMDGNHLEFTDGALKQIAHVAVANKTGARGLRSIVESVLEDSMYTVPSNSNETTVLVTEKLVKELTNTHG